jgi:hypothetical protein
VGCLPGSSYSWALQAVCTAALTPPVDKSPLRCQPYYHCLNVMTLQSYRDLMISHISRMIISRYRLVSKVTGYGGEDSSSIPRGNRNTFLSQHSCSFVSIKHWRYDWCLQLMTSSIKCWVLMCRSTWFLNAFTVLCSGKCNFAFPLSWKACFNLEWK